MSITHAKGAYLINGDVPDAYTTDGTFDGSAPLSGSNDCIVFIDYTKGTEATGMTFKFEWVDEFGTKHKLGIESAGAWSEQADQTIAASGKYAIRVTTVGHALHVSVKSTSGTGGTSTVKVSVVGVGQRG